MYGEKQLLKDDDIRELRLSDRDTASVDCGKLCLCLV